ncbi:MAG TPA: hypothetical protein DDZ38_02585 [Gammaproteobacteria bacterium]|nr:hypothetical protein [Gammaproteobacteria bacterium]
MPAPLDGFRILDLSAVVSGPMAAVVLADQGADVIKIEPPGWGDTIRGLGASRNGLCAIYAMINRNKRSVGIDLKQPQGQDLVKALAADADVLLQNYRPGKMTALGLDYDTLTALNPRLIYASISGMGTQGPGADKKVYDYVIQAMSGILDVQGQRPLDARLAEEQQSSQSLQMVRTVLYDKVTALTMAQGITSALLARERSGLGQHVKLSMLDAALYFNWPDLMWNHSFEGQGVQYSGDLADVCGVVETADGAIVSPHLGADCSGYETDALLDLLGQHDIPSARVNRREDVATDPQVMASRSIQRIQHPRGGTLLQARSPIQFSQSTPPPHRPSADLGEHTHQVLTELGLASAEIQELADAGVIA